MDIINRQLVHKKVMNKTIYLDNAATTFPKPPAVLEGVIDCMKHKGGNPGRSSNSMSLAASEEVYLTRVAVARLFNGIPENVIFTQNATHALNIVIKGFAKPKTSILISNVEHNSVLRPVISLKERGVDYRIYNALAQGDEGILSSIMSAIQTDTKMLVACHRSNVAPIELPIEKIGKLCADKGIFFVVDASQSAGAAEIDIEKCNISALCAPGHKGLYGPQGSGFVLFSKRVSAEDISPLMFGGSGVNSLSPDMPSVFPERFEAGTVATPSITGLRIGIEYVEKTGLKKIDNHEKQLVYHAVKKLLNIPKVRIYAPKNNGSILLFNISGIPSGAVAQRLDENMICVRAGFHCSPLAHNALKTGADGAVRVSVGAFNTINEMDELCFNINRIARGYK